MKSSTFSDETYKTLIHEIQSVVRDTDLNQAQRLFHGRGHAFENLKHITIDWLSPVLLITLFEKEQASNIQCIKTSLLEILPYCKSIQIQHRYQKNWPLEHLYGEQISYLNIKENDLFFHLNLISGRNTGLFFDMKNGREWVRLNSKNKRVLNLFSYTCGFSVAAMAGEALSVSNIDINSNLLKLGRDNHRLNKQDVDNVRFQKLNIFNSFGRIVRQGPYDLLICDPPTYQKGSINLEKDYPKIMRRLDDFMALDSTLMMCINAPDIGMQTGKEFLIAQIHKNAPNYQLVDQINPPKAFLETQDKGSKVLIFKRKDK